jgi:mono/diheme cytochrome c family protein
MKRLLWLFGVSLFATACQQDLLVTNIDPTNPSNPALTAQQGERLFSAHCEGCHADQGVGSLISFQVQNPVVDYSTFIIRNGRNENVFDVEMPAYSEEELSNDEMNSIIFFLRQAPKPTDGAGLYARFCANCHGDDAQGGVTGKDIIDEADDSLEEVREGEGKNPADRKDFMPSYTPAELSNAEVALIVSFLEAL